MPCFLTRYVAVKSVKCSHCMGVHGANGRFTCFIYSCPCFVFSALQLLWIESKRGHSLFLNFLLHIDWTSFFGIYYIMAPTKPSGITQMVTRMRAAANPPKTVAENNSLVNKKRKADTALTSDNKKRSALGDLTNVKKPSLIPHFFPLFHILLSFHQASSKLIDAKKAVKGKVSSTVNSNLARPQLARPSTKALTLNLVKE